MAQVDVSELMTDPDFIDAMRVINRIPIVDSRGENSLTNIVTESVGSVQPADNKAILRLPEALQVQNLMSFWFKGIIVASAPGLYTAILEFKGSRFQVKTVADWSNWGAGWCEGLCVAEGLT